MGHYCERASQGGAVHGEHFRHLPLSDVSRACKDLQDGELGGAQSERTQGLLGLDALRVVMLEALPLDEQRLLEAQIEVNFWSLALGHEALRELQHEEFERFWDVLHYRVSEAQKLGQVWPDLDADDVTHQLMVLVEGLSLEAVLYPSRATPERQTATLDSVLGRISSGR